MKRLSVPLRGTRGKLLAAVSILAAFALPVLFSQAVLVSGSTVLSGQVSVTNAAAAFPNNAVRSVCLTVASGSANTAFIGGSGVTTSTGFEIQKSAATLFPTVCLNVNNTASIFAISSGTATIDWVATTK